MQSDRSFVANNFKCGYMRRSVVKECTVLFIFFASFMLLWSLFDIATASTTPPFENVAEQSRQEINDDSNSFLLLCLTDGSIYSVSAWTGDYHSKITTSPLLQTNRADANDWSSAIVPGLDGRLYLTDEQTKQLQELPLTIHSLLENPVRSCDPQNPEADCGILTAEAQTSLLALSPTGQLLWKTDGAEEKTANTVVREKSKVPLLLQRKDYWVQHVLSSSGQQSWNVSLGTYHALDFDSDETESSLLDDDDDGDNDDNDGTVDEWEDYLEENLDQYFGNLKSQETQHSKQKNSNKFNKLPKRKPSLPSLHFANSGHTLIAVHPITGAVLWRQEVSSVLSSVFGIYNGQWRALEVFQYDDGMNSGLDDHMNLLHSTEEHFKKEGNGRLMLGGLDDRSKMSSVIDDHYQRMLWHVHFLNDDVTRKDNRKKYALLQLPSGTESGSGSSQLHGPELQNENSDIFGKTESWCPLPQETFINLPSKLQIQSQPEGLLLSWSLVGTLVILALTGIAALYFWYKGKKAKWLTFSLSKTAMQDTPIVQPENHSDKNRRPRVESLSINSDTKEVSQLSKNPQSHLRRTLSLPGTWGLLKHGKYKDDADAKRFQLTNADLLRPRKTEVNVIAKDFNKVDQMTHTVNASYPLDRGISTIGGFPLLHYSRYASEFQEVKPMGKGGFGTVFCCKNVLDGRDYAIKKVVIVGALTSTQGEEQLQRVLREVKILAVLDHPNIVRYYTAWLEKKADDSDTLHDTVLKQGDGKERSFTDSHCHSSSHLVTTDSISQWDSSPRSNLHHSLPFNTFSSRNSGAWDDTGFEMDASFSEEQTFTNSMPIHRSARGRQVDDLLIFEESDELEEQSSSDGNHETASSPFTAPLNVTDTLRDCSINKKSHLSDDFVSQEPVLPICSSSANVQQCPSKMSINSSNKYPHFTEVGKENSSFGISKPCKMMNSHRSDNGGSSLALSTRKHTLYIQMELCSHKTISDFLMDPIHRGDSRSHLVSSDSSKNTIDVPKALRLFLQIAEAVKHVHCQGLIHRDLKPSNCFLSEPSGGSTTVKVGDFGLSRQEQASCRNDNERLIDESSSKPISTITDDHTAGVGTRLYASPEQMNGSDYDSSTDVYSLGIMLFELLNPMYTGMERNICISRLRDALLFPREWHLSVGSAFPDLEDMIRRMVRRDPSARPTAECIVRHVNSVLGQFTVLSLDQNHDNDPDIFLLRVEAEHREDSLGYTMRLIRKIIAQNDTSGSNELSIVQYGLRSSSSSSNEKKPVAIMEFALKLNHVDSNSACVQSSDLVNKTKVSLFELLVRDLLKENGIFKARQISSVSSSA